MGNVAYILKRDILRLLKAPAALVVAAALIVLPSLYSWYNVVAFWNPYEATGNLTVYIVNEDAGTQNELTGPLNVGDTLEEELLSMDKLHFVAKDYDTAMEDLAAGRVYAVYVVPEDFTECLISPLTGELKSPQILYFVNEKSGPVSPKITDTAASTLDQTINSVFVAKVSEVAVESIDEALEKAEAKTSSMQSEAVASMKAVTTSLAEVRDKLAALQTTTDQARTKVASAVAALDNASVLVSDAQAVLNDVTAEVEAVQASLTSASSEGVGSLSSVAAEVLQVAEKASTAANSLVSKAGTAQARADLAIARLQPIVDGLSDIAAKLQALADSLPADDPIKGRLSDAAQAIAARSAEIQSVIDEATALSARITAAADAASTAANSLNEAAQQVVDTLQNYSNNLFGSAIPAITSSLAQVSTTCAKLTAAISDLDTTINEAKAGLVQLDGILVESKNAAEQTDKLVSDLQGDIGTISTDIGLLAKADILANLTENGTLNSQNISSFMNAPTELEKVEFYHPNSYGAAMSPLFMNLTFWIGAFMLIIIFRLEVDDEGVKKVTLGQRYLSRFLLFCGFAIAQAIVCCIGVLVLGVQAANVPALFVAAMFSSLAYLSIIYALSANLKHIGMALCIILVFAQIPGGSGLYPLELTDGFFQAIYPFLPFSYGIDALREAIFGFYGNYYVRDLAILALMFVGMLILGIAVVPLISNVARMAARQIQEGDLYNGEDAVVPVRPYRLSQVVSALSDREDYRETLERRYAVFSRRYPIFIRAAIVLGIGVPMVLGVLLALDAGEKVVLLTIVLLWFVCLVVFLLVVESQRYSFERQLNIERMSDDRLMKMFFDRGRVAPAMASTTRYATIDAANTLGDTAPTAAEPAAAPTAAEPAAAPTAAEPAAAPTAVAPAASSTDVKQPTTEEAGDA